MGLSNVSQAIADLYEDERARFNLAPSISANIINESGLYSLALERSSALGRRSLRDLAILRSRKPEAKAFKRWVTHEVLPEGIEATGYR